MWLGSVRFLSWIRKLINRNCSVNDGSVQRQQRKLRDHPLPIVIGTIAAILGIIVILQGWYSLRKQSPVEVINEYYEAINRRQYETAWAKLSDNFKRNRLCCNPDGSYKFRDYISWWNRFKEIQVIEVKTIDSQETTAAVKAKLRYCLNNPTENLRDQEHIFILVADNAHTGWLINESSRSTNF